MLCCVKLSEISLEAQGFAGVFFFFFLFSLPWTLAVVTAAQEAIADQEDEGQTLVMEEWKLGENCVSEDFRKPQY